MKDQWAAKEAIPHHAAEDAKETGRVEAFSDGVFAIAVTLLVLDIKVPRADGLGDSSKLVDALLRQWPSYLSFTVSFLTILVMWVNHHNLMKVIRRTDHTFLLLNGLLLMGISLVPFPTSLLAEYLLQPDAWVAAALISGLGMLIAIAYNLLWFYALGSGGRLLDRKSDMRLAGSITLRYMFGPFAYLAGFIVAFIYVPASVAIWIALAIYFAIPNKNESNS